MNKEEIKKMIGVSNPTIFEIGCANGSDTEEFINVFNDEINLYCFEPEPNNIKIIKNNIKNCKLFEGVISNIDGIVTFNRSRTDNYDDLRLSGSIRKPKEHLNEWNYIKFDEFLEVKSTTIDSFCKNNNIKFIDFIWADVQGAESDMILGGLNMFKESVRYLYTEYSNKEYYENQINLEGIVNLLGDNWSLVQNFGSDALFKNNKI